MFSVGCSMTDGETKLKATIGGSEKVCVSWQEHEKLILFSGICWPYSRCVRFRLFGRWTGAIFSERKKNVLFLFCQQYYHDLECHQPLFSGTLRLFCWIKGFLVSLWMFAKFARSCLFFNFLIIDVMLLLSKSNSIFVIRATVMLILV